MSEIKKSPIKINGRKGIIVHDKLCADGPVDPVTGEPLIDPETGEAYPGPNDDMADAMHEYLRKMRSPVTLKSGVTAPRFGVLTLLAIHTPIFVYDHPAFKEVANTAFTDGQNIFVDADFMRKLVDQEKACGGKKSGVLWTLLHELMHKLYCHVTRLKGFPPDIANIAEDMVINGKIKKAYPTVSPVDLLVEICFGMKPDDAEKYHNMAEEVVAELILNIQKKKQNQEKKEKKKSGNQEGSNPSGGGSGNPDEEGESAPGGSNPKKKKGDKQEEEGSGGDQPSNKKDKKGGKGDDKEEYYSPIHHISPEDLLDIIEKNGLHDTVGKALNLPKKDDIEGIGKMKEKNKMKIVDAVQTAISQANKIGSEYPGAHIADHAAHLIGGLEKGKLSYKLIIRKHFQGEGQKLYHSDEEAGLFFYMDKQTLGVDPFYVGSLIPQAPDESVLVLVDSSGSTMGGTMRKEFLQEALNVKRSICSTGDSARKVFIQSADTVLQGEPILVTDANIESLRHNGIPVFGDGGTSFKTCLLQALDQPLLKKENIKSVIYFTDCIDAVPQRADFEEFINKGIKIVFITTPGMFNEKWNSQITWAEVYCMEENTVVDMTRSEEQQQRNTRGSRAGI